ncbi:cupredoxin domain-containing protein [Coralliovum pocilloporae]|uniref:cupredoxin domain-containing protein n=1 Tax=Coralliovum pocilloporae TaxID=3066369 RepID=UPI0033070D2A
MKNYRPVQAPPGRVVLLEPTEDRETAMNRAIILSALGLVAGLAWGMSQASASDLVEGFLEKKDPAKIEKICAKAEKRYQKIFGKPSEDEDATVILMYKYTFCPERVSVPQGTLVRWVNVDKRTSHSTWLKEAGQPESERIFPEEIVEIPFDMPPGDYPYLCGPHWEADGMVGIVTVTP